MKLFGVVTLAVLMPYALFAHAIYNNVIQKGISVKIYYAEDDPASYCQYEIFKPNDNTAFAKGRTDRNGVVSFLPDSKGDWKIKVIGESDHGYHGKEITVTVDKNINVTDVSRSLYEKYQRVFTGAALIFSFVALIGMYRCKKRAQNEA